MTQKAALQNLLFNRVEVNADPEMYFRHGSDVIADMNNGSLEFKDGAIIEGNTFFNLFSIDVWKKKARVEDLALLLKGQGDVVLRFFQCRKNCADKALAEYRLSLSDESLISLDFWAEIEQAGFIYFTLQALGSGKLESGSYQTGSEPLRDVSLGLVITHYNRQQYVQNAVSRIKNELLGDSEYKDNIKLFVIDNSQNSGLESGFGLDVIDNKNLGGSGGFSRGLLEVESKGLSHCLFMDDDASCEMDAIKRVYSFLQFATAENAVVAGSLLSELEPYYLFESGARFDGLCRPINSGLDVRKERGLQEIEFSRVKPNYGGWWFFAFPVAAVDFYPFPFFVRGDDSLFCLINKFEIVTINGVNSWAEDFAFKSSPMTQYLDARYHLFHAMAALDFGVFKAVKVIMVLFFSRLLSYHTSSANAVTMAVNHVMQGKDFWLKNIDMVEVRKELSEKIVSEKMEDVSPIAPLRFPPRDLKESKIRLLIRLITINGFLLPSFLLKNKTIYQEKSFRATLRLVFGYKYVLCRHEASGKGYVLTHDKKEFFKAMINFLASLAKLMVKYKSLQREYKSSLPEFASKEFWEKIYSS